MKEPTPTTSTPRLFTLRLAHLLAVVSLFGMSWSFYLILPKFLAQELALDAATIGRIVSVQAFAAVAATPVVGILVDRCGRKTWIVAGLMLLVATGAGYTRVDRVGPLLYGLQVLWGVAMVMTFNAAGTLTSDIAPANRMAQAIGLFGAANLGTNAISPAVGELLATRYGWDMVFVASAIVAACGAVLGAFLREDPRLEPSPQQDGHPIMSWPVVRIYVATFMFTAAFTALFTLHQPFALSLGVTEVRRFFYGFAAVALAVRLGGGRAIDRIGLYESSLAALVLYATVPLVLGWLGPAHLGAVGALMGLAHGVIYPAVTALGIERAGPASKGMVVSMVHGAFNAGHAVFALGLGYMATEFGFDTAFGVASAVTLFGAVVLGVRGAYRSTADGEHHPTANRVSPRLRK